MDASMTEIKNKPRRPRRLFLARALVGAAERAWIRREATRYATFLGCGMTTRSWWQALKHNRFRVSPGYLPMLAVAVPGSILNQLNKARERRLYGRYIDRTKVEAPIFVLGHWRSGTTLLHEMLSRDDRFATPTLFQVLRPHTYLLEEDAILPYLKLLCPDTRPFDNMTLALDGPSEDEWSICQINQLSPSVGYFFPRSADDYDRFFDLRGVTDKELLAWKTCVSGILKKLAYRYGKRLILKSPSHTGRIQQFLEMYPDARFVHIRRNPYHVFRSTMRLYETGVSLLHLQRIDQAQMLELVLRRYRMMYDAYFDMRDTVPPGQFCEVSFEELTVDKLGGMRRVYEELELGGWEDAVPGIQGYIDSVADYKKNAYRPLPDETRAMVAEHWGRCFDEWGYER